MEFRIIYYRDKGDKAPVEEFLVELKKVNPIFVQQVFRGIEKLRHRAYHREPLSKYLEPGLWELRIQAGNDILRIFYTFKKGQVVILLHVFIKKSNKTPDRELEIARKRMQEIKMEES